MQAGGWCELEYLNDTERFGESYKEGQKLERFFSKLLSFIERQIFNRISKRVNFLLTRINDSKMETVAPGNKDKNEDGNWRQRVDNNGDYVFEKRISGTWTEANKIHGS